MRFQTDPKRGGFCMLDQYFSYAAETVLYFAVIIIAIAGMIASLKVQSTFMKYSDMPAYCGLSASQVAQRLLNEGGSDATLTPVSGSLTDHFDPARNRVGLSQTVYNSTSVAALAVAAHEIGHVMQYRDGYTPIRIRNSLLPIARIGSAIGPWLVLLGIVLSWFNLANFGAWLYLGILVFQLVTLPVEFNASKRGIAMLTEGGYIAQGSEETAAKKVLRAAAMTYVVAALSTFFTFLRLLAMSNRARRR